MTTPSNLDRATNRARNRATASAGTVTVDAATTQIATRPEAGELSVLESVAVLRPANPARFGAAALMEGVIVGEQQVHIADGMELGGILLRRSETVLWADDPKKAARVSRYHFVLDNGARVRLLGVTQIDDQLADIPADGSMYAVVLNPGVTRESLSGRGVHVYYSQACPVGQAEVSGLGAPFRARTV